MIKKSISYAIFFRLLEGLVFAPLAGLAGQALRGRIVVDSTALVGFFLSPRGLAVALIASVSFLLIRMMEQAGLSVVAAEPVTRVSFTPLSAFRHVFSQFNPLIRAAMRFVLITLGMLAPFLIVTGLIARYLLSRHDINFYLAHRPPVFLEFGAIVVILGLATAAAILWIMVRWRWVVHVILFERLSGPAAFRRSAELVQNAWWQVALRWGGIGLFNVALGCMAAWIGRLILPLGVQLLGASVTSLGILLGCLIVFQGVIGSLVLMAGPIVEASVFTQLYFKRVGQRVIGWATTAAPKAGFVNLSPGVCIELLFVLVGIGGVVGGIWGTEALWLDRSVRVIAHRAAVKDVPENSIPAIERAIQDGADVAEIDVQLSKDGVVVVAHDSDFSRVAGVSRKVADLTWDEIQQIDIGSPISADFAGVRVPQLEQILLAAKDHIGIMIELKHYGPADDRLEKRVIDLLGQYDLLDQTEIQSLEYDTLMTVRRIAPGLKIGYLLSVNARRPDKLDVDFLSVQAGRVDSRLIRQTRRSGQKVYVWTVDSADEMEKMIELGVDGLITNEASTASRLLLERRNLTPGERASRRIRAWLSD